MNQSTKNIWALSLKMLAMLLKCIKLILAAASFASYSYMFGWRFAVMIMSQLFIHESGHVWAMKKRGIPTKGFYFIPFMGGAAIGKLENVTSRKEMVYIALLGPLWGGSLAVLCFVIGAAFHSPLFVASAAFMAMINLINLLPVMPLDGGRVAGAMAQSAHISIGIIYTCFTAIGAACMVYFMHFYLMIVLGLSGVCAMVCEIIDRKGGRQAVFPMNRKQALWTFVAYFSMAGAFILIMAMAAKYPGADAAMKILEDK